MHREMWRHGEMRRNPQRRCIDRLAWRAAHRAYVETELNLTPEQRPLWDKLQNIAQGGRRKERLLCQPAEARRRIDRARPDGPGAAIPVGPARRAAIGQARGPGALPIPVPRAEGGLRPSVPPRLKPARSFGGEAASRSAGPDGRLPAALGGSYQAVVFLRPGDRPLSRSRLRPQPNFLEICLADVSQACLFGFGALAHDNMNAMTTKPSDPNASSWAPTRISSSDSHVTPLRVGSPMTWIGFLWPTRHPTRVVTCGCWPLTRVWRWWWSALPGVVAPSRHHPAAPNRGAPFAAPPNGRMAASISLRSRRTMRVPLRYPVSHLSRMICRIVRSVTSRV